MGCACKNKQNKIAKLIPEMNYQTFQQKGILYYVKGVMSSIIEFLFRIFLTIFMITVSIPFVIAIAVSLLIFNKPFHTNLPKAIIKKLKVFEKNYG